MRTKGARWACAASTRRTSAAYALSAAALAARSSNGAPAFGRAAEDRHAARHGRREGLAGQRARIEDRLAAQHRAVYRHHLARTHEDHIAGLHLRHRHGLHTVASSQLGDLWRPLDQGGQLPARPARGHIFKRGAAGEHQANHDPGELLSERQRADHRHERNRVHAHVSLHQHGVADFDHELGSEDRDRHRPHVAARTTRSDQVQQPARYQGERGKRRQQPRAIPDQPVHSPAHDCACPRPAYP
jgi:hypothetical protein